MQALWDFHRLPIAERTAQFDKYYDRTNVVDWYLLVEFTAAADLLDKNSILTTWDGTQYCWMPYDLDTTFGLHWAGIGVEYASNWNWDANNIIPIVKPIILNDVIKRYAELRNKGILTLILFIELSVILNQNSVSISLSKSNSVGPIFHRRISEGFVK